ncbi:hypothetical protein [Sporosarcina limicola]|uniref:DUF4367 domain-containing protein n=1 Tax=Sporosarcina limicola TaxID=34101 RepID=A0A927MM03_9BACL|nr:hypothetical protein [Sporosarcina limicola]MBE1557048.1 hypothetical protein [Sporosarcina limicola]
MDELQGELARKEINFNYEKDNLPLFMSAVFESPEEIDGEDLKLPGEKLVTIRGQEGLIMESGDFRSLLWKENGVSYSIVLDDPSLTFEELIEWTNDMVLVE